MSLQLFRFSVAMLIIGLSAVLWASSAFSETPKSSPAPTPAPTPQVDPDEKKINDARQKVDDDTKALNESKAKKKVKEQALKAAREAYEHAQTDDSDAGTYVSDCQKRVREDLKALSDLVGGDAPVPVPSVAPAGDPATVKRKPTVNRDARIYMADGVGWCKFCPRVRDILESFERDGWHVEFIPIPKNDRDPVAAIEGTRWGLNTGDIETSGVPTVYVVKGAYGSQPTIFHSKDVAPSMTREQIIDKIYEAAK